MREGHCLQHIFGNVGNSEKGSFANINHTEQKWNKNSATSFVIINCGIPNHEFNEG